MDESDSLRQRVERLLPGWESWYPSIFDAAVDLGLIRARVCSPSSLLLSRRHAAVQSEAEQAHREQWGGAVSDDEPAGGKRRRRRRSKRKGSDG